MSKLTSLLLLISFMGIAVASETADQITLIGPQVPPFSWQEEGNVRGINMDVISQAGQQLGYQVHQQVVPLKRAFSMVERLPNVLMVGVARTAEREHLFTWVAPILPVQVGMLGWQDSAHQQSVDTNQSLAHDKRQESPQSRQPHVRAKLCVHYNTPMEDWLKSNGETDYIAVTSEQACLSLLAEGLVKHWFTEFHLAQFLTKKSSYSPMNLIEQEVVMQTKLYLAGPLTMSSTEAEEWRMTLVAMAQRGEIDKIIARYVADY
ncbi:substrate-binding periplasmic protein [Thalassotalea euphylliae]|uniref:substrate-binding periplasmic protein n=1 Tax=Thalassotalea euphylliae TaxID=1655234 RepID=UPI0015F286D2|nr:transporter substrate-binding domain-containing protein [Thalassotalea euphylliae]